MIKFSRDRNISSFPAEGETHGFRKILSLWQFNIYYSSIDMLCEKEKKERMFVCPWSPGIAVCSHCVSETNAVEESISYWSVL